MAKGRWFDYDKQAWVIDGRYICCNHPETMACGCYGREHAGEYVQQCNHKEAK